MSAGDGGTGSEGGGVERGGGGGGCEAVEAGQREEEGGGACCIEQGARWDYAGEHGLAVETSRAIRRSIDSRKRVGKGGSEGSRSVLVGRTVYMSSRKISSDA